MGRLKIAILGSTGSIGRQAMEIARMHSEELEIYALAAHSNVEALIEQWRECRAKHICLYEAEAAKRLKAHLRPDELKVHSGMDGLIELATLPEVDIVLNAVSGSIGLLPTLRALEAGKRLALANKEALVIGGHIVIDAWRKGSGELIPVDSEHSAIFQCLLGERSENIKRIILTASGGPFRQKKIEELKMVTPSEALSHPTWRMGPKVTIDSATLMNKGLEIIEAMWLFDTAPEKIEVLIHPQSIIHSLVEFVDGSMKAQLSLPDMRLPIQYALLYPKRLPSPISECELLSIGALTFEPPDVSRFPCLRLAREAAIVGGSMPAVMSAADEIAVKAFLRGEIGFMDIPKLIESVMEEHDAKPNPPLDELLEVDEWAKRVASERVNLIGRK
ncbi:MAG: 1-deoxy-D-xylulose-5-phosphate reductoisomerase [Armatimonadota bacterium]|nr:1-deoxy-D-xylulose-5-phosphate reductoisomerase [Armatimonadota bacterium]MCX7778133.1 1-deoxy-D-xylulose-5-phosphate reductoisomerase [Armatimonadota bacterium]MDW8024845.1 1-deoxy-D-xylulose-5-phosphate reductoisomerase [Armatimonadota bacterium]